MLSEFITRDKGIDIFSVINLVDFLMPVPVKGKIRIGNNYDGGEYTIFD